MDKGDGWRTWLLSSDILSELMFSLGIVLLVDPGVAVAGATLKVVIIELMDIEVELMNVGMQVARRVISVKVSFVGSSDVTRIFQK